MEACNDQANFFFYSIWGQKKTHMTFEIEALIIPTMKIKNYYFLFLKTFNEHVYEVR